MNVKKITKFFLFLYIIFFSLIVISPAIIAQEEHPLEVEYPEFPNIEAPTGHPVFLTHYVRYLYQFAVISGGLVAFLALLTGGFRYLTSAGNPGQMSDARNQMLMGILGVIIVLSSFVLLKDRKSVV